MVARSLAIKHLQSRSNLDEARVLYVYFRHGVDGENQPYKTFGSLLRQLMLSNGKNPPSVRATTLLAQYQLKNSKPPLTELIETLAAEVKQYKKVYVVLDALDESSGYNGNTTERGIMQGGIKSLQRMPNVNLMITSRSHVDFDQMLFGFLSSRKSHDTFTVAMKEIRANADDLRDYATFKIQTEEEDPGSSLAQLLRRVDDPVKLKREIVDAVVAAAGEL